MFQGGSQMLAATYNALCDLGPYYLRNCFCPWEIILQPRSTGMFNCIFMVQMRKIFFVMGSQFGIHLPPGFPNAQVC